MKDLRIKDFEIKCYRSGGRLANAPEYMYKIIYHASNGQEITLDKVFCRKADAEKYIRKTIEIAKMIKNRKDG